MKYFSTRDTSKKRVSSKEAILTGLAPDGGLYVPEEFPQVDFNKWQGCSYEEVAFQILSVFLTDYSHEVLRKAISDAYRTFAPGVVPLKTFEGFSFLELFHGKTMAFKDVALSFLPQAMSIAKEDLQMKEELVIVTATSGDTGKAALEGFKEKSGMRVVVYYPKDGVSPLQQLQMATTTGDNTCVLSVVGNFDDAQSGVKEIFSDKVFEKDLLEKGVVLSSANSINIGRLLPQIVYYFFGYLKLMERGVIQEGEPIDVSVPTGNFGNILAAYYARQMGLPIASFICASNENRILTDFFHQGKYDGNRELVKTISPSMDILVSSNLERLLFHMSQDTEVVKKSMEQFKSQGVFCWDEPFTDFKGSCITEEETLEYIEDVFRKYNYVIDPHTSVGYGAYQKVGSSRHTLIAATASPYKFPVPVLKSLGCEPEEGIFRQLEQLEKISNTSMPEGIRILKELPIRHEKTVEKEEMKKGLCDYLEVSL